MIFPSGSVTPVSTTVVVMSPRYSKEIFSRVSTYMVSRFRIWKLARCLLTILLIQEYPIAKFAMKFSNHSEALWTEMACWKQKALSKG